MSFWGADTEGLTRFARSCEAGSRSVAGSLEALEAVVRGVDWVGPDGDRVRAQWGSEISPGLRGIVEMLEARGNEASSHAEEQDKASTSDGAATTGAPSGLAALGGGSLAGAPGILGLPFGGLLGAIRTPSEGRGPFGTLEGSLLRGTGISSEIGMPGIAPGEPDPGKSIWDWVLGERDTPVPDLPGEGEEDPNDPVPDPGDIGTGRDDDAPNPADGPQKPANWPEDMPWPPNGPASEQGDDGQYVYGDEGYGAPGDATNDERPVGTAVDEGGQRGGSTGTEDGGAYVDGQWVANGGASVTQDEHSNFTVTAGGRAGVEGRAGAGGDGTGLAGTGSAEIYAEGGGTIGPDGYGVGWRVGAQAGGSVSYAETNEDGSSSIYTVEARAEAGAGASHYGHRVRNEDGDVTGWATGFDVGGGASAGYEYTEEWVSPNGWFQTSTTTSDSAGRSVGLSGNAVISTDEVSLSLGGGIPGMSGDSPSGFAIGVNPNKVVSDLSGGAFDADDAVETMREHSPFHNPRMPLWA